MGPVMGRKLVTSVLVGDGPAHTSFTVFVNGASAGKLIVRNEEAPALHALLTGATGLDHHELSMARVLATQWLGVDEIVCCAPEANPGTIVLRLLDAIDRLRGVESSEEQAMFEQVFEVKREVAPTVAPSPEDTGQLAAFARRGRSAQQAVDEIIASHEATKKAGEGD